MKSKPQLSIAPLIVLALLTALHALAMLPMLAVVWMAAGMFGPGGRGDTALAFLALGGACSPLAIVALMVLAAWLLYAWKRPWAAVVVVAVGFAVPLIETVIVGRVLFSSP